MFKPTNPLSLPEFVTLLAMMISILALSIDAMLPALGEIGRELRVADPNDAQLVVTSMFLGFAVGQIFAGPLSDCFGRKSTIYAGYVIFIVGCLLSIFAQSFDLMLAGRVLQGLGAAFPRIVSVALVRDGYEGRAMARIMSIVMAIFILVPAIAPAIGQGVMLIADWRSIFTLLLVMAVIAFVWFALRQPETLAPEKRQSYSIANIVRGFATVSRIRALCGYTIVSGVLFGAFLGYLNSAQQVFQVTYDTGDLFAVYFGVASLAIGAASIYNSKVVERLGMRYLAWRGLIGLAFFSWAFLVIVLIADGVPDFWIFMAWLLLAFFSIGLMFGNFNALAMEPVGDMAGLGAAFFGAGSTFVSLPLGWAIGAAFDGTLLPMVAGFAVLGTVSIGITWWIEKGEEQVAAPKKDG